jgi:hypothetical protein
VREASSPFGSIEFRRLSLERIPPISRLRISDTYVAPQYTIVNFCEKPSSSSYCTAQILAIERDRQMHSRP